MSASLALAGLTACTKQPLEPIVPYVRQPEEITLGKPLFFATANTVGGYAVPVLAESHEGRPTKIEGNPQHPATLGGTDVFTQASILDMYDPDRSQTVMLDNEIRTWGAFVGAIANPMAAQKAVQGAGLRILSRIDDFAHAGRADQAAAYDVSAGEVGTVRPGGPRQRSRRRASWRSGSTSTRNTTSKKPT